jgi:hypothetical protein
MDGLMFIRSVTLSNQIAETQLPEGVVVSYLSGARVGRAEITLSHLTKGEGYKEPVVVERIWGSSVNRE